MSLTLGFSDPWNSYRGWLRHPTKNLLMHAQLAMESPNSFVRQLDTRLWVITALAVSVLETLGRAVVAGALLGVWALQNSTCMLLRGTFILTWGAIGYISTQATDRSLMHWVQFIVLQVLLGYANPGNWWAQWKLWGRVMRGMGDFANGAAATADQLERYCKDFAHWSHVVDQTNRTASLTLFGLTSLFQCWRPTKVMATYSKSVEPLPDRSPLHHRIGGCLQRNWGLVGSIGLVVLATYAHYNTPGYEERVKWAEAGAEQLWGAGGLITKGAVVIAETAATQTIGRVANYFSNKPDYITANELNQRGITFLENVPLRMDQLIEKLGAIEANLQPQSPTNPHLV